MNTQRRQHRILGVAFILAIMLIGIFVSLMQQKEEKSYFEYTEADVKMLGDFMWANIMYAKEFGTLKNATPEELEEAYKLSGSVVLHRLEARISGETMREVIYAPGQYDAVLYSDFMINLETTSEVYEWAEELLKYGPQGPEGLIYEWFLKFRPDKPYREVCGIYFYEAEGITKKVTGGKVN